jgi:hypothetical protein
VAVPRRFDRRPPDRDDTRINERIRVREVRLIGDDGNQIGVVPIEKALEYAQERDLDLVEVAPESKPPVCRVLDYSKYKYEQEQKAKAARKHQKQVNVREIKLRPKIANNDYERAEPPGARRRSPDAPRRGRGRARHDRAAADPGRPQHDDVARAARQEGGGGRRGSRRGRRRRCSRVVRLTNTRRQVIAGGVKGGASPPSAFICRSHAEDEVTFGRQEALS